MIKLNHIDDQTNLPLSNDQKRLWVIQQQDKLNPAYNLVLTYRFNGKINYGIFKKSIDALFKRQHTLFSVFKQKEGVPFIKIKPVPVNLELVNFSNRPLNLRKEEILGYAGKDSRKPFDIEEGPLYRLYLLKHDEANYYFHATIHHLVFDGWSMRLFIQDLEKNYNDLILYDNIKQEPLNFHSYDYAVLKEKSGVDIGEKKLLEFWKETLKGSPPALKFPYDYQRKSNTSGLGQREPLLICEASTSKLKELSKKCNTSLFKTMLSLLGLLFNKYTGENEICIGFPISNRRKYTSIDEVIGLFAGTSLVRLIIKEDRNLVEHIIYSRNVINEAIENSELPFNKIVEAANPERRSNMNPLFQVALSWWNNVTIPINLDGIRGERINVPEGVSPFDITFYLWENGNHIEGEIEYNIDIIKQDTIIRLRDNFLYMIQSITENYDKIISDIPIVSENDKKKILEFNKTEALIPSGLLQKSFEKQASLKPSKTAIISGNSKLTYKELNNESNQLARHLLSLGVNSGDIVGICIERSIEMIMAVMGILKAGCGYLPLDPEFPDDRINYMSNDSNAKIIISQSSLKDKFHLFTNTLIVLLDIEKETVSNYSSQKPDLKLSSQLTAYTIYTSGSTGKPKGVKIQHEATVNLIESMSKVPGIKVDDILLAVITLSFDMSVYELFVPLSNGATIVIASTEDITNGPAIIDLIEKHNITLIQATPSFWAILNSSGWQGNKKLKALCGGEALTSKLVGHILPKVGEFWNCYGPTEATVYATCIQVTDPDAPILIGKPINNTTIHILDKNNMPLPIGVIGELSIGGAGIARGYHNQPELTKTNFIQFKKDKIIYKTGDLGRYLNDGNIELFGRQDNQIKIRGFRIEPSEIEALLVSLKGVREAVVKTHRFDESDKRLVAFLNVDKDFKLTREEMIKALAKHLPQYMIPSFYQKLNGFPKTPNDKINKAALKIKLNKVIDNENKYEKTLTPTEKIIFDIWSSVLKTKNISILNNFFDIGGNSLLAISVFSKIESAFNLNIGLRVFFDSPKIRDLAEIIEIETQKSDEKKNKDIISKSQQNIIKGEI